MILILTIKQKQMVKKNGVIYPSECININNYTKANGKKKKTGLNIRVENTTVNVS